MNRLNLILPKKEHKEIILDYKKEFLENKDSMDGSAGLSTAKTFEEWFSSVQDNLKEETVRKAFLKGNCEVLVILEDSDREILIDDFSPDEDIKKYLGASFINPKR